MCQTRHVPDHFGDWPTECRYSCFIIPTAGLLLTLYMNKCVVRDWQRAAQAYCWQVLKPGPVGQHTFVLQCAQQHQRLISLSLWPAYIPRVCAIVCAGKSRTVSAAMKSCERPELRVVSVVGGDKSSKVSWPGRVLLALGYRTGKFCMTTCMRSNSNTRQQLKSNAYYCCSNTVCFDCKWVLQDLCVASVNT